MKILLFLLLPILGVSQNLHDGVCFIEEGYPIYAVFNSNQIKSVENNGTWGIAADNIFS